MEVIQLKEFRWFIFLGFLYKVLNNSLCRGHICPSVYDMALVPKRWTYSSNGGLSENVGQCQFKTKIKNTLHEELRAFGSHLKRKSPNIYHSEKCYKRTV
jgi:hypothetical protein